MLELDGPRHVFGDARGVPTPTSLASTHFCIWWTVMTGITNGPRR